MRHKTLRKRPKVSVAIGLVCSGQRNPKYQRGIVFAADSQKTDEEIKTPNTNKIAVVNFLDGQVLVAQAGVSDFGDRVVGLLREKAKDTPIERKDTAAQTAEDSLRQILRIKIDDGKMLGLDAQQVQRDNDLDLLIGHFFQGDPCFYTVSTQSVLFTKVPDAYKAIGVGRHIAGFLLRQYHRIDPEFDSVFPVAVGAIAKTIENVNGCNRPICLGVVRPIPDSVNAQYGKMRDAKKAIGKPLHRPLFFHGHADLIPMERIEEILDGLKGVETDEAVMQKRLWQSAMQSANDTWRAKIEADLRRTEFPDSPQS